MKIVTNAIAALSVCASLTACAPEQAAATVDSIQSATIAACGFLPAAETILGIMSVVRPEAATASAIAGAICRAVTHQGGAQWEYHGVPIHGHFVTRR